MEKAKKRLTQVFKFLKELSELQNPVRLNLDGVKQLRLDEWPKHSCLGVWRGDSAEDDSAEDAPMVRVGRAEETDCPRPNSSLKDWMRPGWDAWSAAGEKSDSFKVVSRNFVNKKGETFTVQFGDDKGRIRSFAEWAKKREEWITAERPNREARKIYDRVSEWWDFMRREGDDWEIMLADGMLSATSEQGEPILHPLLLRQVTLEPDFDNLEFQFVPAMEKPPELHLSLLRQTKSATATALATFNDKLRETPLEPLDSGSDASAFLRRLALGGFARGEWMDSKPDSLPDHPVIWREPVIFLRRRVGGRSGMMEAIQEKLKEQETSPPEGLARIVGVDSGSLPPGNESDDSAAFDSQSGDISRPPMDAHDGEDILFSKRANDAQKDIARRLAKHKSVIVQGPPGTGKTHTIANLLGHLLSQGKTVLVTAHTTKALRVLREKVDEALRPLCLSVLDRDSESYKQLSEAAGDIKNRLSSSDSEQLRKQAADLRKQRKKLSAKADNLRRQLLKARQSEIDEIVVGGEGFRPIDAAKRVKDQIDDDGWLPGPLHADVCPLSDTEVRTLYQSQNDIVAGDEIHLAAARPEHSKLMTPANFCGYVDERKKAESQAQQHRPELWGDDSVGASFSASDLSDLHRRVEQAAHMLSIDERWLREALFAGWSGGDLRAEWEDLLSEIDALSKCAARKQRLDAKHGPKLPAESDYAHSEAVKHLENIIAFLDKGNAWGLAAQLAHPILWRFAKSCQTAEGVPVQKEQFESLLATAEWKVKARRFVGVWNRTVVKRDGPANLGETPERVASEYAPKISECLKWRDDIWNPLAEKLQSAGFQWDAWLSQFPPVHDAHGELERTRQAVLGDMREVVAARAGLMKQEELRASLQDQRNYLSKFPQSQAASFLLQAQDNWHAKDYEDGCREIARLEGLHETYQERVRLLARLESAAPEWALAVARRIPPHDKAQAPGNAAAAWLWRCLDSELKSRASVSMERLQTDIEETESELLNGAASIIEKETWAAQCERIKLPAKQALAGFVQAIRRVGKGTGKHASEHMRTARECLSQARDAVPVWIMPLSRVYENFDPRRKEFDVVIIDEASQSNIMAMAALYLGREHVVVGDKEQVTPDAVGQAVGGVNQLIADHLQDIPNSRLYDGQTSIYDLAEGAFGGALMLQEHFRCVPDIIEFSNQLSYSGRIIPLREPSSSNIHPAMVSHRVKGFRGRSSNNIEEAREIASLIAACIEDPECRQNENGEPASIGVISLLGKSSSQALEIGKLLRSRPELEGKILRDHKLLCGNAAEFQGDERDIIFLSMIDSPQGEGCLPMRSDGPQGRYKKRYNVAASRARNQLWVVHSLSPENHLQPGDLRRRLIDHARNPAGALDQRQVERTESPFETRVIKILAGRGYRVKAQWPVGAYRIDLVVEGTSRKLAVECDGERWHSTPEQLEKDINRQVILERLGWTFSRIRGSVFFRDEEEAMAPVFAKLESLGIEPLGGQSAPVTEESDSIRRIKNSAEALRKKWGWTEEEDADKNQNDNDGNDSVAGADDNGKDGPLNDTPLGV